MQKWTKQIEKPTRIAMVLFDQFSNLCLANCLEPLRAANTLTKRDAFEWSILSANDAAVLSSSGMEVLPHKALSTLARCDYLFILVSYGHDHHDTPANRSLLRRMIRKAEVTVALDSAPWLLASAGFLDGRRATVHWDLLDEFTERFLEVDAVRAQIVRDGPFMTCAGAMSALDLTLGLIADHLGQAARLEVEALFMHGDPPVGAQSHNKEGQDPLVQRAMALMRENIETPLSLTHMAQRLSCQPRTLDRRFRTHLGAPPGTVYRHLRLSAARKLIEGSRLSIAEIAVRCGYDSPAALSRAIKALYGVTPSGLRHATTPLIRN